MKRRIFFVLLLIAAAFGLAVVHGCKHEGFVSQLDTVCFDSQVLPIFTANCTQVGCHNGGSGHRMSFTSYSDIVKEVTPYNSAGSRVYKVITAKWDNPMPPHAPLTLEQRTLIRVWIDQGAKNTSCSGSTVVITPPPVDTAQYLFACFTRDILPILNSSCAVPSCHDAVTHRHGLTLTSYTAARNLVVPNYPNQSTLYNVINGGGDDRMPPSGYNQLTQAQIDSIYSWISLGALNANCGDICDTSNVTFALSVWPIIQNNCTGCHSGSTAQKGIHLENYANVAAVAADGMLDNVIHQVSPYPLMPPGSPLSSCKVRTLEIWMANGYPND